MEDLVKPESRLPSTENMQNPTDSDIILISSDSEDEEQSYQTVGDISQNLSNKKTSVESQSTCESHKNMNGSSNSLNLNIDEIFKKFIDVCTPLIEKTKDASEIITFIKVRHAKTQPEFKSSLRYRNLLNRCIRKLENGCNQEFVYINEVATVLGQHSQRKRKPDSSNGDVETSPKHTKLTDPSSSNTTTAEVASDSTEASDERKKKIAAKVEHYEKLLQRFSDEIKKLQAHELSLEEMDDDHSIYVQEGKLKEKAMLVFNKLCQIKEVPTRTGRVIERKITLRSSRYPEINKKVESYVNQVRKFPDYYDINYLVKQTNKKHNLQLEKSKIDNVSKNLFEDIGKQLQRIRHYDFIYNFGSYLTDPITEKGQPDPAENSSELQSKLKANRVKAKSALDDVIKKFSRKQEDVNDECQRTRYLSDKSLSGSEPPSDQATTDNDTDEESNSEIDVLSGDETLV